MSTFPENPGFTEALHTFRQAAQHVPAYKDFLSRNAIDPESIQTPEDFKRVPAVTKENYLKQYPLNELLIDGDVSKAHVISMSSGSSGTPFFWFRNEVATHDSVDLNETIFRHGYNSHEKNTLVILAFAMGTWIAGTYMFTGLLNLAENDHKINLITPGINKQEILYILQNLAPLYDQVVLAGYPPFVKDVLDEAENKQVDLQTFNLKLLFAGENYSEAWRDYVLARIHKPDDLYATVGIYGTADAGIMGHENALSVFTRRAAMQKQELFKELFPGCEILPTLVEYIPEKRYVEVEDDYLLFTIHNALPLVRYRINDEGRIMTGTMLQQYLKNHSVEVPASLNHLANKDYIALYGRSDVATTFYALDIFPENIKYGLEKPELEKYVTGKFVLKTEYTHSQEQSLHLYVELKSGVEVSSHISDLIFTAVLESLRKYNSEFNKLYQSIGTSSYPHVHLLSHNSPEFEIHIKHKWTHKA